MDEKTLAELKQVCELLDARLIQRLVNETEVLRSELVESQKRVLVLEKQVLLYQTSFNSLANWK